MVSPEVMFGKIQTLATDVLRRQPHNWKEIPLNQTEVFQANVAVRDVFRRLLMASKAPEYLTNQPADDETQLRHKMATVIQGFAEAARRGHIVIAIVSQTANEAERPYRVSLAKNQEGYVVKIDFTQDFGNLTQSAQNKSGIDSIIDGYLVDRLLTKLNIVRTPSYRLNPEESVVCIDNLPSTVRIGA